MAQLIPMSPSDFTWLQMDRPTNLMLVRCLMWYAGDLDIDELRRVHVERMVDQYEVFKQRAVNDDGRWYWQPVDDFDINRHIYEVKLPGEGDRAAMLDYVATTLPEQFDFDHPLWNLEIFRGVTGLADEPVTVIWQRFHHAMMDGIRMVQLLVHLHDFEGDTEAVLPGAVGRTAKERGRLEGGLHTLRRGADEAVDIAKHVAKGTSHLPYAFVQHLRHGELGNDLKVFVHPSRIINAFERLGEIDNKLLNTTGELARLITSPHESRKAVWSSPPVVGKRIEFIDGMELSAVREFGKRHRATFNDVMLAIVSKALTHYLEDQGTPVEEVHWMVPVSLTPIDPGLPRELGNDFALVFLAMPLGISNWADLLDAIRERSARLKNSQEPTIAHELQRVMARFPKKLSVGMTNLFASKTVGVLTNVPGPKQPMLMAGAEALGWIGFVPTSGDEPLGICVFSYNDKVFVGVTTDAHAIPDPDRIAELIKHYYDEMESTLAPKDA
ncbi:MAG: DUF1298 domain-containing protein [Austwickia sp.]|nr:DUF1298 domain-containing protein [Austwickia sp.]